MADEAKNELAEARAEYKAATGKNPSPRLDAAGVRAKLAEIQANPPADKVAEPVAEKPAKKAAAPKAVKAAKPTEAPHGTVYVRHPEGIGCSLQGVELVPERDGKLLVPHAALEELQSHGFEVA